MGRPTTQLVSNRFDLPLPGEKHQNISGALATPIPLTLLDTIDYGIDEILVGALGRPPPNLNWKESARDLNHRSRFSVLAKVLRKTLRINRGRSDHYPKIRTLWQEILEIAQQKINV